MPWKPRVRLVRLVLNTHPRRCRCRHQADVASQDASTTMEPLPHLLQLPRGSRCGPIHVDHVLPRSVMNHDQIWNLVLTHSYCNMSKSDKLVGKHFMEKLIFRNENIMGSNHPWKNKISLELGSNKNLRKSNLLKHYENV